MSKTQLLLVEDDVGVGRMLERGLAAADYTVKWVRDLQSAAKAVREGDIQIIVLDRMLPDGDGVIFCSALRKSGSSVPICILTARETLEDKVQGFNVGADDYLVKPFEFDELIVRLAALMRRTGEKKKTPVFDEKGRNLSIGQARISFTKREWPLVRCFFAHFGEALSRETLIAAGWGNDADVTDNSVDVYVGYLRRKITPAETGLRIETVRGVGFRLISA